jgi:hypothetical protein
MTFGKIALACLCIGIGAMLVGCGGKDKAEGTTKVETPKPAAVTETPAESEGVAVAKEILGTFDKAVAEIAELVKDKPEAAALKPKLDGVFEKYKAPMTELNAKYLALRAKDIQLFGDANGYLGNFRGRHVFEKDNVLSAAMAYYNIQKGEKEIVKFLSLDIVNLIEIAVKN